MDPLYCSGTATAVPILAPTPPALPSHLMYNIVYPSAFPSSLSAPYRSCTYSPYFPYAGNSSSPEEDVFVAVNLPVNNEVSPSAGGAPLLPAASPSASTSGQVLPHHLPHHHHHPTITTSTSPSHLQRINYQHRPTRPPPALPPPNHSATTAIKHTDDELSCPAANVDAKDEQDKVSEQYPYVQFAPERPQQPLPAPASGKQIPTNHEYSYPVMDIKKPADNSSSRERRDSIASIKKANQQQEQLAIATTMSSGGGMGFSSGKRIVSRGYTGGINKGKFGSIIKRGPSSAGDPGKKHHRGTGLSGLGGIILTQRCRYCDDTFYPDNNHRGSCEYAPDSVRDAIDSLTCIGCAQCMLYHCMSDEEGEFVRHPCACSGGCCVSLRRRRKCCCCCCSTDIDASDGVGVNNEMMGLGGGGATGDAMMDSSSNGCGRRWIGLTLLSLLVPCLCCYLPLRACHSAFASCGMCGARHEPAEGDYRHPAGSGKYSSGSKECKYVTSGSRGSGRYNSAVSRYSSGGGRYSGGSGRFDAGGS